MAATPIPQATPVTEPPKIHEATRATHLTGAVFRGAEIEFATAVHRRQAGEDVVVCGDELEANRVLAQAIEAAIGPYITQRFHSTAGPLALPHIQQQDRNHPGHTFYETTRRKSRKEP